MPRTLCILLPDWPVQRSRRERPELVGKPLVLCQSDARVERVAACSAEARRLGIARGMKTPDAQGLAGPARLVLLRHSPGADRRALERLAADCERFSPTVALEDATEPAAVLCDLTGLAPLWSGGEQAIATAVGDWALAQRLEAVIAIGPTIGASLAAARYVSPERGPVIVANDQTREFASRMPIESLRLDESLIEGLRGVGVESIGQLLELPRASLPSRFGGVLVQRLDQLLGEAVEPVESFRGSPPLAAVWEFESGVTCPQSLEAVRSKLLDRLTKQLVARRCGALRVLIEHRLEASHAPPVYVVLRLFRPTTSARELAELANLHLEGVRFPCAVRAVALRIGAIAPIEARQRTLFEDHPQEDPHALALLINRLSSRLGAERVLRVQKRPSVDPRRAYVTAPATDVAATPFSLTALQTQRARRLPLTMPAETEPIAVETNEHGEPVRVRWRGDHAVARCWGPERIETGWWRGRSVRRDAWWVELEDGGRLWLHSDFRRREWTIAGGF